MYKIVDWIKMNIHRLCTVIVFGELLLGAGLYLYYTKTFLDPVTTDGMHAVPGKCSMQPTAATAPTATGYATTSSPAVTCFRDAQARPSRGLPAITKSQAIDWCCGPAGTPGRDHCASFADAP